MKVRDQLLLAVLLQGSGSAATLLAALWIGKALGPEQQGQFSLVKSTIEFGAALAALGMPQALYVHAQSGQLDLQTARRIGARVALLGFPVGLVLAAWVLHAESVLAALALAACVMLACLQSQWRALTLLGPASWRFNLVTVSPQLLLLPLAAWVVLQAGVTFAALATALSLVWLAGSVHAAQELRRLRHTRGSTDTSDPAPLGVLARHGLATWVTASLATFCIMVLQRSAGAMGGSTSLGVISLGFLLMQLPLAPLGYAVPLLLRWRITAGGSELRISRYAVQAALPMAVLALGILMLGQWRSDLWMGAAYAGLHTVVACLMLGGAADAAMRLLAVDAQAEGRPAHTAQAEVVRTVSIVGGVLIVGSGLAPFVERPILALAAVWTMSAFAALAAAALLVSRHRRASA